MMKIAALAFLLLWITANEVGNSGAFRILDTCGRYLLMTERTKCRTEKTILANLVVQLGIPNAIQDVCALRLSYCFHDTLNDEFNCTFDPSTFYVDCGCPMEGVRWTEGRINDSYVPGKTCVDLNECEMGNDDCDPIRATCNNVEGGFECTCKNGYNGDGKNCVPDPAFDPCTSGFEPVCDPNADCAPQDRVVGCYGFSGLPTPSLVDSAGIKAFDCLETCNGLGTTYAVITGGTSCHCTDEGPSGAEMVGACNIQCGPTEEETCGDLGTVASYYHAGGDHTCTCKTGFTGNGTFCSDLPECDSVTPPPNSICNELPGSYEFVCDTGFIEMADSSCVVPNVLSCDEIETIDGADYRRHESWAPDCSRVEFRNCDGSGVPETVLVGTASGTSICTDGTLVSQFDPVDAFPMEDFIGNTSWSLFNPVANCGETKFTLTVDRVVMNAAGFSLDDMGLGNFPAGDDTSLYPPECRGRRYYDLSGPRYLFEHDFSNKCGLTRIQNSPESETIIFRLTGVIGRKTDVITRESRMDYRMACTYTKTLEVHSGHYFQILDRK